MPKLLCNLRQSLEALGFGKPSLKVSLVEVSKDVSVLDPLEYSIFKGVSDEYLQQIVTQVNAEGFHVESLVVFRYGNLKPSQSIFAIEQWAKINGLKVGINHEYGICFFEKL